LAGTWQYIWYAKCLSKTYNEGDRTFYDAINYGSRKAGEIGQNNRVSLMFVWLELERQIMINGSASKISAAPRTVRWLPGYQARTGILND
jgi:pyridoxine/pyridoxamine 5'-phosphate oxidase